MLLYFILGYLAAVLTLFLIGTVIGIVYLVKLKRKFVTFEQEFDNHIRDNESVENDMYRYVEEKIRSSKGELTATIDSRIDKLKESMK